MRICVLGAGIVGLATAWQLRQQGHDVTVIDRAQPGHGASGGNGAQLSYSYVAPLADPGIWGQLPKLLLAADSPLKLRPRLDPLQWQWGLRFLAACNAGTARATTAQLLILAAESRAAFDAMRAKLRPDCDFSATGKLVLYDNAESLAGARRQLELQRQLGSQQQLLTAQECVAIEPALDGYRRHIAGAVHTPSECAADCLKLCQALAHTLAADGARLLLQHEVQGWVQRAGRAVAVKTQVGEIEADTFVLALGTASHAIGRQLGVYLPVYPLKGYSITVTPDTAPGAAPRVSVTDSARKVVFARLGERLRVAGMAEIVGADTRIPPERIRTLVAATQAVFPQCGQVFDAPEPWTGMRPATPTGLPIVGRVGRAPANVLFNTGHGALGLTLAFGTAGRIAAQLPMA